MDFVAIDVETANADMASICQIGIAAYRDGEVEAEWVSLIDPEDYFAYPNMCVHGIHPEDVVGAPTLPQVIDEFTARLTGTVAVCHTHFDRVSVRQACEKYGLPAPECRWLDSAKVARRAWTQFATSGYGLSNLCDHLGHSYGAHDALEDAKAAGVVLLAAMRETGMSLEEWIARTERPIGSDDLGRIAREGNPEGPLFGEVIIFTGALFVPRREAADMAAALGCTVGDSVTKKTTLLVVGDQDVAKLAGHDKSSKHRKAEELIAQGHPIRIIRETDFVSMVESTT